MYLITMTFRKLNSFARIHQLWWDTNWAWIIESARVQLMNIYVAKMLMPIKSSDVQCPERICTWSKQDDYVDGRRATLCGTSSTIYINNFYRELSDAMIRVFSGNPTPTQCIFNYRNPCILSRLFHNWNTLKCSKNTAPFSLSCNSTMPVPGQR